MKIAILSFYSGLVSRGVETFVHELTQALQKKVNLKVYQADTIPQKPKPKTPNLFTYLYLDNHSLKIKSFTQKILKQLQSNPPDILLPLNNGWMTFLSKRFCSKHKTKLVLAGFSGIGWDDKVNLWLKPDAFVACTRSQANWAKTINPQANITAINIGVNPDKFKPQGKKYSHGLKSPVVLAIAGPEPYKRIKLAIKAVSQLNNASLLVVGSQPQKILKLGQNLLGSRFKNISVNYQDLDSVYRSVDIFTLPSESHEAYGITILEALATNLPVVVNHDPIRQELVGQAGILVDPSNLDQYAKALKTVLTKTPHLKPRQQALKFSWEKIAHQHFKLWQSLIN